MAEAAQGLNIIITIIIITIIIFFTILIPFLLPLFLLFFAVFCINWFCLVKWSRWLEGLMEGGRYFFHGVFGRNAAALARDPNFCGCVPEVCLSLSNIYLAIYYLYIHNLPATSGGLGGELRAGVATVMDGFEPRNDEFDDFDFFFSLQGWRMLLVGLFSPPKPAVLRIAAGFFNLGRMEQVKAALSLRPLRL